MSAPCKSAQFEAYLSKPGTGLFLLHAAMRNKIVKDLSCDATRVRHSQVSMARSRTSAGILHHKIDGIACLQDFIELDDVRVVKLLEDFNLTIHLQEKGQ